MRSIIVFRSSTTSHWKTPSPRWCACCVLAAGLSCSGVAHASTSPEMAMSSAVVIVNRCDKHRVEDGEMKSAGSVLSQMSMSEARRAVLRLLPGATV